MFGIALLEIGAFARNRTAEGKLMIHAMLVAAFLVLGHVVMVFGMLDPTLGGASPSLEVPGHAY